MTQDIDEPNGKPANGGGGGDKAGGDTMGFDEKPATSMGNPNDDPQSADSRPSELTKSMVLEMHDIKCNDGLMKLEISTTETKGIGMKKYTVYLIKGHDSLGEINCFRRYSEFLIFRDFLYSRYPGLFIPPVPTK